MKLELVRQKGWMLAHLTANGTDTLCGRKLDLVFGERTVMPVPPYDPGRPETLVYSLCGTCRRVYKTQQEFREPPLVR
jgi:hypothetical protein